MASDDNIVFPWIPEKNWWILRDQFKKSMPKEVSTGYVKSLLQLDTDSSARNIINPLKKLGLLDEDNKTTDLANDWRNDEKYSDVCNRMLAIYPQELRDLFSDPDASKPRIENWFRDKRKLGNSAASKSASLYLLLLEAQPKSSTDFAGAKKPVNSDNKKKPAKPKAVISEPPVEKIVVEPKVVPPTSVRSNDSAKDWLSLHIDMQIHISPEADAEQIDNIFASMSKHIMSMRRDQSSDEGN